MGDEEREDAAAANGENVDDEGDVGVDADADSSAGLGDGEAVGGARSMAMDGMDGMDGVVLRKGLETVDGESNAARVRVGVGDGGASSGRSGDSGLSGDGGSGTCAAAAKACSTDSWSFGGGSELLLADEAESGAGPLDWLLLLSLLPKLVLLPPLPARTSSSTSDGRGLKRGLNPTCIQEVIPSLMEIK